MSLPEGAAEAIEPLLGYLTVVARRLVAGKEARVEGASDLVQLTVVAALDNMGKGKAPCAVEVELKAWLRGIMLNIRRQMWRRSKRHARLVGDQIDSETSSPSNRVSREELEVRMAEARSRLCERDRQILDWRYRDQFTFECIGERLGISAPAVHKAHRRALERLEDAFLEIAEARAYRLTRSRLRSVHREGNQA